MLLAACLRNGGDTRASRCRGTTPYPCLNSFHCLFRILGQSKPTEPTVDLVRTTHEAQERNKNKTHRNFGSHLPFLNSKNLGVCDPPLSSNRFLSSLCTSSTFDFASVAASMSLAWIARVKSRHNLRDSFGSCSDSGATHFGATFWPSFCASKREDFTPVYETESNTGSCLVIYQE